MTDGKPALDPRIKALYLAVVAVGVFLLPRWWMVGAAAALQVGLWFAIGLPLAQLLRQVRKLSLFLGVIFLAYALVTHHPETDDWRALSVFGVVSIDVNLTGALLGLTMVLRVLAVVLASQVARAGDPRALASGLRKLGVPRSAALSIDATLALLGDRGKRGTGGGQGDGRGGGGGGGRRGEGGGGARDFLAAVKRLARGDVGVIVERLRSHVARVEAHLERAEGRDAGAASRAFRRDVAVIAGVALTMLGIKLLKLLPGLPLAPGHKGVLLIPLYIGAGFMTRSRAGATLTGVTMGTVAFLLGDGRYGVFEIAKHITPGILVDLMMPLVRNRRSVLVWALVGLIVALGRFATVVVVALAVQAPAVVYAFLVPGLLLHGTFGVLSGAITAPLLRALRQSDENGETTPAGRPRGKKGRREAA